MDLQTITKIAESLQGEGVSVDKSFQVAVQLLRTEVEKERNDIIKRAFVIADGYPSALEKIAMIFEDGGVVGGAN